MFYAFAHTLTSDDKVTAKKTIEMPLTEGIIHQIDVLFQDGCDHEAQVQIYHGNQQLWPTNRGATIVGNATVVSFRDFVEVNSGETRLHAFVWGDGIITDVDVTINIGLLPKAILQPFSLAELLRAVQKG